MTWFATPAAAGFARGRDAIVRKAGGAVPALTNTVADARSPAYARALRVALKQLRQDLPGDAAELAGLTKIDARTLEGLQSFADFVAALKEDAEPALLSTLLTAGGAGARAAKLSGFTFNLGSDTALQWAKESAADLVTSISEKTRDGIKAIVERAFSEGVDVPHVARNLRERLEIDLGNYGGLTERDYNAVASYRARLVDDGLDPAKVEERAAKLAEGYLRDRTVTIARHEILAASNQGQLELWRQADGAGLLDGARRVWLLTDDSTTCPRCEELASMDENQDVGVDDQFTTIDGDLIDGPPEHVNCRCSCTLEFSSKPAAAASSIQDATGEDGKDDALGAASSEADDEVEKIFKVDAGPCTLYVRRDLLNVDDLAMWARGQGLTLQADPHVTVAYSTKPLEWPTPVGGEIAVTGGQRAVQTLGDEGAVVLSFYSGELGRRWGQLLGLGASWNYDQYNPHVTITYEPGNVDLSKVEPYLGPLVFGPEIFEEVKE